MKKPKNHILNLDIMGRNKLLLKGFVNTSNTVSPNYLYAPTFSSSPAQTLTTPNIYVIPLPTRV